MSAYEDDADRLAEHNQATCEDDFCQLCRDEEEEMERTKQLLPGGAQGARKMSDLTKLESVLTEMSQQATELALAAWDMCAKEGRVGNYPIPNTEQLRMIARKYFLTGYGMALVDHTMEATKRLHAASDLDQTRNLTKFKV